MPKNETLALPATPDEAAAHDVSSPIADTVLGDDAFDAVEDEPLDGGEPEGEPGPSPLRRFRWLIVAGALLALGGGLLAYRSIHRARVLRAGLARAGALVRLDTAAGYREAAALLEPLASLDPIRAASVRAYALGMLFADYRDTRAENDAEALLVAPDRAGEVPAEAHLANAALALGRREAGNAMTSAARAGADPLAKVVSARVAFLANNLSAAAEPARAGADAGLPAALALHGDLLRRTGADPTAARDAYLAALAASPLHPRAAFGLAKLALSGLATAADAEGALRRLADDRTGTPANERARAALHLASLRVRADDRAGANAALDAAGLDAHARTWAEAAVAVAATRRGSYRAVEGAPASLRSASDDDPGELPAIAPAVLAEPRPAPAAAPPPAPPRPAPKAAPARHAAHAKPVKHVVAAKRAAPAKHASTAASKKASAKAKSKPAAKKDAKKTAKKRKAETAAR